MLEQCSGGGWQTCGSSNYTANSPLYEQGHETRCETTLVNAGFGVRWLGERIVTSIKVTNLGNQEIQQHIFGDILKRQVAGEVRVSF